MDGARRVDPFADKEQVARSDIDADLFTAFPEQGLMQGFAFALPTAGQGVVRAVFVHVPDGQDGAVLEQ